MRLMAAEAAQWPLDLRRISGIVHITHRMPADWMTRAVHEVKTHHTFLREIVLRQANLAVEDAEQMSVFHLAVSCRCAMALGADTVAVGAQQLRTFASVRVVTSGTTLFKYWLVQNFLGLQVRLIDVTVETHGHRIRLRESRRLSGVRIVAIRAIPLSAGMLKF